MAIGSNPKSRRPGSRLAEAVTVVVCSSLWFYMPFLLALSPILWIVALLAMIRGAWRRGWASDALRIGTFHAVAMVLLFAFAPQQGMSQIVKTGGWDGLQLSEVVADIQVQTGLQTHFDGTSDEGIQRALRERVSWRGGRMRLATALDRLSERTPVEFGLATGLFVAASLSGNGMVLGIGGEVRPNP